MEEKKRLKKLKEYEKIGTLKEFKELYKIKTTDYIHRGEGVTERDYYYYTNGAQAVLDEVEQLKKENADLKSSQNKIAIEKLEELYKCFNEINNVPLDCEPSIIMNRQFALHKLDTMLAELKREKDEH